MRILAFTIFALAMVTSCIGCGTFLNFSRVDPQTRSRSHPKIYGGTRLDGTAIAGGTVMGFSPVTIAGIVDMPFSAVGDTVTLPVVIAMQRRDKQKSAGTEYDASYIPDRDSPRNARYDD